MKQVEDCEESKFVSRETRNCDTVAMRHVPEETGREKIHEGAAEADVKEEPQSDSDTEEVPRHGEEMVSRRGPFISRFLSRILFLGCDHTTDKGGGGGV